MLTSMETLRRRSRVTILLRRIILLGAAGMTLAQVSAAQTGIENCWDYVLFRMNYCRVASGYMHHGASFGNYKWYEVTQPNPALHPGDVILVNPSSRTVGGQVVWDANHVAYVNPSGTIDHFLQSALSGPVNIYQSNNLPDPRTVHVGGQFLNETWATFLKLHSPPNPPRLVILIPPPGTNVTDCPHHISSTISGGGPATPPTYVRGRLLATKDLPGAKSTPTDVGIVLQQGKAYFVAGSGSVSLWDGQNDGCDSVFRYKTPLEPRGGAIVVWGQLELFNPDIHLSDLIQRQTGKAPVYTVAHVYQAMVIGSGQPLRARVFDGGGYSDNHGQLTVSVYEAVPSR